MVHQFSARIIPSTHQLWSPVTWPGITTKTGVQVLCSNLEQRQEKRKRKQPCTLSTISCKGIIMTQGAGKHWFLPYLKLPQCFWRDRRAKISSKHLLPDYKSLSTQERSGCVLKSTCFNFKIAKHSTLKVEYKWLIWYFSLIHIEKPCPMEEVISLGGWNFYFSTSKFSHCKIIQIKNTTGAITQGVGPEWPETGHSGSVH